MLKGLKFTHKKETNFSEVATTGSKGWMWDVRGTMWAVAASA